VLVWVQDEQALPLLGQAARIAAADGGLAVAVSVATDDASASELAAQRHLVERADEWLAFLRRLSDGRPITYVGPPAAPLASLFAPKLRLARIDTHEPIEWLRANLSSSDWVVLPGLDLARESLKRFPGLADRGFLVTVAGRIRRGGASEVREARSERLGQASRDH